MQILDANIVLRYLLGDHEDLSEQAARIIDNNATHLPTEVLCEVVYVLEKVYKAERTDICSQLILYLTNTDTLLPNQQVAFLALRYYTERKLDFVDCLLAGYAIAEGTEIHTFDKNLRKFIDTKMKTK